MGLEYNQDYCKGLGFSGNRIKNKTLITWGDHQAWDITGTTEYLWLTKNRETSWNMWSLRSRLQWVQLVLTIIFDRRETEGFEQALWVLQVLKIVGCSTEEYFHHYHFVARLTWKEVVIARNNNFEFLLESLGLEWLVTYFGNSVQLKLQRST